MGMGLMYDTLISSAEATFQIPTGKLAALFAHESNFNIDAVGDNGLARGIGQMHKAAAETVGGDWDSYFDTTADPDIRAARQINDAAAYLTFCFRLVGDWKWALAAYNQGPTVITKGLHYAEAVEALEGSI